jgi:hypothetical protein
MEKDGVNTVGGGPLRSDFKKEGEQPNIKPDTKTPKIQSDSEHIDEIPEEIPESDWT